MIIKVAFKEITHSFRPKFGEIVQIGVGSDIPAYSGDYEVTPTEEKQTLKTAGKRMVENVVIAPIPSQYGLVTYDQNKTLTVS